MFHHKRPLPHRHTPSFLQKNDDAVVRRVSREAFTTGFECLFVLTRTKYIAEFFPVSSIDVSKSLMRGFVHCDGICNGGWWRNRATFGARGQSQRVPCDVQKLVYYFDKNNFFRV